jgi:hypothetical protein
MSRLIFFESFWEQFILLLCRDWDRNRPRFKNCAHPIGYQTSSPRSRKNREYIGRKWKFDGGFFNCKSFMLDAGWEPPFSTGEKSEIAPQIRQEEFMGLYMVFVESLVSHPRERVAFQSHYLIYSRLCLDPDCSDGQKEPIRQKAVETIEKLHS